MVRFSPAGGHCQPAEMCVVGMIVVIPRRGGHCPPAEMCIVGMIVVISRRGGHCPPGRIWSADSRIIPVSAVMRMGDGATFPRGRAMPAPTQEAPIIQMFSDTVYSIIFSLTY